MSRTEAVFKSAKKAAPRLRKASCLFGTNSGETGLEEVSKMYAIVENGSKQYKAEVGSVIKFEKLNANVGDTVEFNVLMVADENGVKVAEEAKAFKAVGEVTEQGKFKKIIVYKYKAKKNERKKQGHRQPFTAVKITEIAQK